MTRFAVRKLADTGVTPLGNLVKGNAHQVIVPADRVLAAAEEQARDAYEQALREGREAGEAEGGRASAALMAETVAATRSHQRDAERRLIGIVVEAVRRILGEFDDTELTARMVRKLLRDAEGEGRIVLRVSPRDLAAVQARVGEVQTASDAVEVVADAAVEEGGCRMETELGFVNTSVAAQLDALRTALERYPSE